MRPMCMDDTIISFLYIYYTNDSSYVLVIWPTSLCPTQWGISLSVIQQYNFIRSERNRNGDFISNVLGSIGTCDDITIFPLFFPYFSILLCSAAPATLRSIADPWSTDFPVFCWSLSCVVLLSSAVLTDMTSKHTWNVSDIWHVLMLLKCISAGAYPTIVHCLGFICSIYTSILDEGYVLTWCLNPIDTFCVCPASRLIPEHSTCWNISILTCFTTWTSNLSRFTSLPLFSWLPPLALQGQPAEAKVAKP